MKGVDNPPTTLASTDTDSIAVIKFAEKRNTISSYFFTALKGLLAIFGRETI